MDVDKEFDKAFQILKGENRVYDKIIESLRKCREMSDNNNKTIQN